MGVLVCYSLLSRGSRARSFSDAASAGAGGRRWRRAWEPRVARARRRPPPRARSKLGDPPPPFHWPARPDQWPGGYLENGFYVEDEAPLFSRNIPPNFYAIYTRAGNKSFFSDNMLKYSSPAVIAQIAAYGKFIDGYSAVRIDRARDFTETLVMINPYQRPVIANVHSDTAGEIRRIRIEPNSAAHVRLDRLLEESDAAWSGQIQISASNRVITYIMKHSFVDPLLITDHEHLDPYRGESTHLPAFSWLRLNLGFWLKNRPSKK